MRAPGLSGWLAICTSLIVTAAVLAVSIAAIGSLRRLAAAEGLTRVELAIVAARDGVYASTEDLLTVARLLAERPTLSRLLRDADLASVSPYLERYCEAAMLDACAVVRGQAVTAAVGDDVEWHDVIGRTHSQGDRFFVPGAADARPLAGAGVELSRLPGTSVFVLRRMDDSYAARLSERAGLEIRIEPLATLDPSPAGPSLVESANAYAGSLAVTTSIGEPVALLSAVLPAAEVMQPVQRLTRRVVALAAVVAALAAVTGVVVGRHWISGVDRLTASARRIGAGNLAEPVPPERGKELGVLAATMEQVRTNLLELEAARRTRDTVLANISHEFRTPLAAQLASIELLHDGLGRMPLAQQRELVESLERGAQRLTRLIDNLLESVRIESGQLSIRQQDVVLVDVVEAACDLILPLIRQRGQRLSLCLDADLPAIRGDRQRLLQVLVNLLANASKFGPPGSLIEVGSARSAGGIELWVEDEGPGLAEADDATLFGQFRRAAHGDPEEAGLGLGLFIVRSIVERHGGRVTLSRTDRPGTRALIVLPERN